MTHTPRFHANNLRKGRVSECGRAYVVTTVCHERSVLLADLAVQRALVLEMQRAKVQTLAFVLMPDHVHWLLVLDDVPLADVMRCFKSNSARWANTYLKRSGRFWQAGFHDHALRREEDLRAIARYIVSNPLRAGLVDSIGDYGGWDAVWV